MNSPETPLFHKGATLYNLHNARKAAHEAGTVIAVEGYIDVIAMTAAGLAHVVAPLGTALTPEQCALLWRMAEEPILCFDGDKAGLKAADRAIDTALPLIGPGRTLRFVLLPGGQDPDELLRSGGAGALEQAMSAPLPLVEMLWRRETQERPLDTPERRAALERRLAEVAGQIQDAALRRYYGQDLSARLSKLFSDEFSRAGGQGWRPRKNFGRTGFGGPGAAGELRAPGRRVGTGAGRRGLGQFAALQGRQATGVGARMPYFTGSYQPPALARRPYRGPRGDGFRGAGGQCAARSDGARRLVAGRGRGGVHGRADPTH